MPFACSGVLEHEEEKETHSSLVPLFGLLRFFLGKGRLKEVFGCGRILCACVVLWTHTTASCRTNHHCFPRIFSSVIVYSHEYSLHGVSEQPTHR